MSLLELNTTEQDDAARGEDFTKGTSHILIGWAVGAAVVLAVIVWYAIAAHAAKHYAEGQAVSTTVHFVSQQSSGVDASGAAEPTEVFTQTLVFTHLKVQNRTKNPLFLRQILTNVTLADGVHSSYAAPATDYERLFQATPALAALHGTPLAFDSTIPPEGTVEGDIVASFHLSQEQWQARKGLDYTVNVQYQPDLVVTAPASVAVQ
jgi:hypothetical protein